VHRLDIDTISGGVRKTMTRFSGSRKAHLRAFTLAAISLVLAALVLSGCQTAASYPSKSILFVVPYSPGGGTDIMIRNLDKIATEIKALPHPMVIENKAGGSGVVGKSYAKEKPADGYTLVAADDSTTFTSLMGNTPWAYNDFSYIAKLNEDYNMIVVRKDSPYGTMKELIDAAKAKPKSITMAGTGVGQVDNVHAVLLEKNGGGAYNYVSFDSGGQVITNLLGGQVDTALANPNEAYEQIRAGTVRALGISAPDRTAFKDPLLKDVPTWKESGVNLAIAQWRGVAGPPGMKKEHVDYLISAFKKITDSQQWKEQYVEKFLQVDTFVSGEEFKKQVDQEYATFKVVFEDLGLYKKK
jgi:putative tricarboxylic transport membrane protein